MTNTIVLKSSLVMPTIGYELDRDEMTYVDGGLLGWSSSKFINNISVIGACVIGGIASIATSVATAIFATICKALNTVVWLEITNSYAIKSALTKLIGTSVAKATQIYGILSANSYWLGPVALSLLAIGTFSLGYIEL